MDISKNDGLVGFCTAKDVKIPDDAIVVFYNIPDIQAYCQRIFATEGSIINLGIIGPHLTRDDQLLLTYLISDSNYSYDFIVSIFERLVTLFVKLTHYMGHVYYFRLSCPGQIDINFDTEVYYDPKTIGQFNTCDIDGVLSTSIEDNYFEFMDACTCLCRNDYNLDSIATENPDYYEQICNGVDMTKVHSTANMLKMLRLSLGLSQAEFAKKYHINLGTYVHWEQGVRKPPEHDVYMLKRLAYYDIARQDEPDTVYDCIDRVALDYGDIFGCPVIVVKTDGTEYSSTIKELIGSCPEQYISKYEFKKKGYTNVLKIYMKDSEC